MRKTPDLPGYCAPAFTFMSAAYTSARSVQVLDFSDNGRLIPRSRLYAIPVRQTNVLPAASFRFRLATDTLAVRLPLPPVGCGKDFHLQADAPCRAHHKKTDGNIAARLDLKINTENKEPCSVSSMVC